MSNKLVVKDRFGVTPNDILNDPELTFKAKGIWGYIQSKPSNWSFSVQKIQNQSKDKKASVSAGIQELEEAGLLIRKKFQNEQGHWDCEYILNSGHDRYRISDTDTVTDYPTTENPTTENRQILVKKKEVKKNIVNNKKDSEPSSQDHKQIVEIIDLFKDINPTAYKRWYGNTTQRQAIKDLLDSQGEETVKHTIHLLPQVKGRQFFPTITTPCQLRDKWATLETAFLRLQESGKSKELIF